MLAQAVDAQVQSGVNSVAAQASGNQQVRETALGRAALSSRVEQRIPSRITSQTEGDSHMLSQRGRSSAVRDRRLSAASAMQGSGGSLRGAGSSTSPIGDYAIGQPDGGAGEGSANGTQKRVGSSSGGGSANRPGVFPDSTREVVGVSPPFGTSVDMFSFKPGLPAFNEDFDVQHLNPNYQVSLPAAAWSGNEQTNSPFSSFNSNNIQQNSPAQAPSTTPSDPIAAELQSILHPDQQRPNP